MKPLLLVLSIGAAVFAVFRILDVPIAAKRGRGRRGLARLVRVLGSRVGGPGRSTEQESTRQGVKAASSRLLFALIVIALGTAILIAIAIAWIGGVLQGILS